MKIIKPTPTVEENETDSSWDSKFTPLPKTIRSLDDQRGNFFKSIEILITNIASVNILI